MAEYDEYDSWDNEKSPWEQFGAHPMNSYYKEVVDQAPVEFFEQAKKLLETEIKKDSMAAKENFNVNSLALLSLWIVKCSKGEGDVQEICKMFPGDFLGFVVTLEFKKRILGFVETIIEERS